MSTIKHINSKNADYSAAEAYLTIEHDEFTRKPTLDKNGRLIPREDHRISTLNCGDEDFVIFCLRTNFRCGKNQKREDAQDHGLTVDMAQALGEQFRKDHFPGHQAIVCTHPYVHTPGKSSGHRVQDVDISYNYIGILPANLLYDIQN